MTTPTDIEIARLQLEQERLALERERSALERARLQVEMIRPGIDAVIRFAEIGIRSLLILNGGAALALLSFASSASSRNEPVTFKASICAFGAGAALSVLTAGLSYASQSAYNSEARKPAPDHIMGVWLRNISFFCGLTALGMFVVGVVLASKSFN
jgi:hypothetical protein